MWELGDVVNVESYNSSFCLYSYYYICYLFGQLWTFRLVANLCQVVCRHIFQIVPALIKLKKHIRRLVPVN